MTVAMDAPAIPPEVAAAEDRLAGDCVAGHAAEVLEHVRPAWLYGVRQRRILERSAVLIAAGREVDLVALCEGQDREAMLYASTIIDASLGGANVRYLADLVHRDWRRRETIRIGRALAEGVDSGRLRELGAALSEVSDTGQNDGLDAIGIGAATLARSVIKRPPSLFGAGLMAPGDLGILYAKPRLGKTWLALMLGRSIARGDPWLGLPTTQGRVAMIGMETPDYVIQERYLAICREYGLNDLDDCFTIISRNQVKNRLNLLNDEHLSMMRTLCVRRKLDLLILDALSRFHTVDEVSANEMGEVLGRVDDLRAKTGTAILLLHHEPKGVQGQEFGDDLDALRGSTRLQSDPTFAARLVRFKNTNMTQLRFAKVSYGVEPQPLFLTQDSYGVPTVRNSPETVGDENREKVRHQLDLVAENGATSATLMARTNLRKSAVAQHLGALCAVRFRSGGEWRWVLPTYSGQQLEATETVSGATSNDDFGDFS